MDISTRLLGLESRFFASFLSFCIAEPETSNSEATRTRSKNAKEDANRPERRKPLLDRHCDASAKSEPNNCSGATRKWPACGKRLTTSGNDWNSPGDEVELARAECPGQDRAEVERWICERTLRILR